MTAAGAPLCSGGDAVTTVRATPQVRALESLGHALKRHDYRFVTVTPDTHARILRRAKARGHRVARSLRDVFGWNLPFHPDVVGSELMSHLNEAEMLQRSGELYVSKVRFASLGRDLFAHSAYPTEDEGAVFFGPDTYRFCRLLAREVPPNSVVVDVGAGSGAGGLHIRSRARHLTLADINPGALSFARANADLAQARCTLVRSDVLRDVDDGFDVVVANPPYMNDAHQRAYRHGGGLYGQALSKRIVEESAERLPAGGMLVLYTGAAVVDGVDVLWEQIADLVSQGFSRHRYVELDPDVFGEELDGPAYADVDRIAAVALVATR